MAERIILVKDKLGVPDMVAHSDRGVVVGHTVGRVTFQINGGVDEGKERADYQRLVVGKPVEPITQKDHQVWEELMELRRMLHLPLDETTSHRGRNLRELLNRINRITAG